MSGSVVYQEHQRWCHLNPTAIALGLERQVDVLFFGFHHGNRRQANKQHVIGMLFFAQGLGAGRYKRAGFEGGACLAKRAVKPDRQFAGQLYAIQGFFVAGAKLEVALSRILYHNPY